MAASQLNRMHSVKLVPKRPPGRGARKALAFALQFVRLQALSYTFVACRDALAEVGFRKTKSTVRPETTRGMASLSNNSN